MLLPLLGPLLYRFAVVSVLAPSADVLPRRWSCLLRQMLRHRCCLGPLACICFAIVSTLAPSADAFAALMVFVTWADDLLPGVPSGCFAAVVICGFTSLLTIIVLNSLYQVRFVGVVR